MDAVAADTVAGLDKKFFCPSTAAAADNSSEVVEEAAARRPSAHARLWASTPSTAYAAVDVDSVVDEAADVGLSDWASHTVMASEVAKSCRAVVGGKASQKMTKKALIATAVLADSVYRRDQDKANGAHWLVTEHTDERAAFVGQQV